MDGKVIGITTCEHCDSRFRLRERHARMEGKPARCSKCHQVFTLHIQRPSVVEQAAIENCEEQEKKRTRRTTLATSPLLNWGKMGSERTWAVAASAWGQEPGS